MDNSSYPIRVVVDRTGLKADLIRVWERRYQAVTPARSPTGRRLYSDGDILRLQLLRRALESGWRISDVSNRSDEELTALVVDHEQARESGADNASNIMLAQGSQQDYLHACLQAVDAMDLSSLEMLLNSAETKQGLPETLDHLMTPLLNEIGWRWEKGDINLSHEHMVSATLRAYLDTVRSRTYVKQQGFTLLSTTPVGQNHELGALMTAATAATLGWNSIYMNPNTPATEIAWAADATGAKVVALSIVYPANDALLYSELQNLTGLLPTDTYLLIGGSSAERYRPVLNDAGNCVILNSQREVREFLSSAS